MPPQPQYKTVSDDIAGPSAQSDGDRTRQEQHASPQREDRVMKYRIERISNHKTEDGDVYLLAHWGDLYEQDPPTWEPENRLWEDCQHLVLRYWSPNGVNTRTKKLGLHKYDGPFTVSKLTGKKTVNGSTYYRVEWVGYQAKTWEEASNLPVDSIIDWEANRRSKS